MVRPLISCTLTACGRTKSFRSFNPWLFGSTMLSSIARWPPHFKLTNAPLATSAPAVRALEPSVVNISSRGHLAIDGWSSHTTSSTCGNQGDAQLNRGVVATLPVSTTTTAPRWPPHDIGRLFHQSSARMLPPRRASAARHAGHRAKPQNAGNVRELKGGWRCHQIWTWS